MFRFKSLFCSLPVCLGIIFMLSASSSAASVTDKPEIFVQLGHQSDVNTAAFSPDGKYLATGSSDKSAKLWDAASGSEIRTFTGHKARINAVAVSAGGRLIVAGDEKGNIKLWDATSGRKIQDVTVTSKDPNIRFLSFSPDGLFFSSITMDGVLTVWDIASGEPVKTVGNLRSHAFMSSGEVFAAATGSDYKQFSLLGLSSGNSVGAFRNEKSFIDGMSFSRDGRYGLFMTKDYQTKRILYELFDIRESKKIISWAMDEGKGFYKVVLSPDGSQALSVGVGGIKLWDAMTGRELGTLTNDLTTFADFSPDGRFLISAGLYAPTLWETSTGRIVRSFMRRPFSGVYSATFSPDGRQVLTSNVNAAPLLWDIANGKVVKTFKGYSNARSFIGGKYILLTGDDKKLELWDATTQKSFKKLQGAHAAFSRDGRYFAELTSESQIKVREVATGKEILTYTEPAGKITASMIAANHRYLLTVTGNVAKRIDLATGAEETFRWGDSHHWGSGISPDGRIIVVIVQSRDFKKTTLILYDVEAKREILSYPGAVPASSFAFSPDESKILFSAEKKLILCDISTGAVLKTFAGHADTIWDLGFSPGGERIISAGVDGSIRLWDIASGQEIMSLVGHTSHVQRALFSPDGKQVISAGGDNTTRLWDAATGKELARFLGFADGEWIVITPEGYYNATSKGEKYLNVSIGNNVYGIENYREAFYRPDLVGVALSGGSLTDFRKLADIKQPPTVIIVDTPKHVTRDQISVKLQLTDQGGGIGDIRLYLNGTAVIMDSRAVKITAREAKALVKEYTLKLAYGKNIIKAVAFNGDNSMQSNEATLEVDAAYTSAAKPSLHALVIGINEFKNPKLKLKYPVTDADLFAATLQKASAGLFDKVNIRKMTTREATTNAAIIREVKSFQSLRPDDLFVFYIASHGTVDEGEYFLITSNVGSLRTEKLKTDAISQHMLKEAIANIPATKKLIIIDTCNAGALGEAIQVAMLTRGMSEDTALKILSRAVGSTILSASTSVQEALEGYQGHGLFTYVLAEGLKGKADKGKTGYIKTTDLADYVDNEVPILAEKVFQRAQYPTISISGQAFPIGKVR